MPLRHTFSVIQGLSRNAKVRSDPQGDNKFNHDDDLPAFFVAVTPRVLYHGIDHVHPQCDKQSLRNVRYLGNFRYILIPNINVNFMI